MSVVDDFLQKVPNEQRRELERIRGIVREVVPDAVEVISYGMPGFKYKGKYLVGFCHFKDHLSLFPTNEPVEMFKDRLDGFRLSKGTIQFKLERPLPEELIREIVRYRVGMIEHR